MTPRPTARTGRPAGATVWFTGLSGAGKSTVAKELAQVLSARGVAVEILDGDEVRTHLSAGLTFSRADRDTNVHRIGYVAALLARHGVVAVTAAISPYAATRAEVRQRHEQAGVTFVEVYAAAPLEVCAARDVKGLYRQAERGELSGFTGVDDPYEPPAAAEVVLHTDTEPVGVSVARVVEALEERGIVGVRADAPSHPPAGKPPGPA